MFFCWTTVSKYCSQPLFAALAGDFTAKYANFAVNSLFFPTKWQKNTKSQKNLPISKKNSIFTYKCPYLTKYAPR